MQIGSLRIILGDSQAFIGYKPVNSQRSMHFPQHHGDGLRISSFLGSCTKSTSLKQRLCPSCIFTFTSSHKTSLSLWLPWCFCLLLALLVSLSYRQSNQNSAADSHSVFLLIVVQVLAAFLQSLSV